MHSDSFAAELAADRRRALALTPVSRETLERLDVFVALLMDWRQRINLVGSSTLPQLWTRHISDSLQLLNLAPQALRWLDLGSGAGFPGLAIACALADKAGASVQLIESNGKKAAFLREAIRVTGSPAQVHAVRIENFVESCRGDVDIVTARALAPLKLLLGYCEGTIKGGAVGLFPKGQDIEAELTEATRYWDIQGTTVASRVDANGRVLVVRALKRRSRDRERDMG